MFEEPLQQVDEAVPKSYSEPMYPRAEADPRPAEPYGYDDRLGSAERGYGSDAPEPLYPSAEHPYPGHDQPDVAQRRGYHRGYREDERFASGDYRDYEPAQDGAYESGEYADEERAPYYGEERDPYYDDGDLPAHRPERRRGLLMVAALFALAVVGTAGAFGYRSVTGRTAPTVPPVIKADNTPNKIASASQADGNKQIYERLGDQGERMVSREEQPVDIRDPGAPGLVPAIAPSLPDGPIAAPATVPVTSATPPRGGLAVAAPAAQPSEPKKIHTVTIRPDQQGSSAPAQRSASRPANAPLSLNPQGAAPAETPAAAPARRLQTALAAPPPRPSASGNYVVQLSAQKSESEAQASFRALQAKYPSVLGHRQPLIRKKDRGAKGIYYGAQVGPFASREEAAQLCENLKSAGGTCFVERN